MTLRRGRPGTLAGPARVSGFLKQGRRDRVQRLGRRVGLGGLVADLNVTLPSAEHLLAPELADVLIRHGREQPGALPPGVMLAQPRPCPGGRLKRVLNQVGGELPPSGFARPDNS